MSDNGPKDGPGGPADGSDRDGPLESDPRWAPPPPTSPTPLPPEGESPAPAPPASTPPPSPLRSPLSGEAPGAPSGRTQPPPPPPPPLHGRRTRTERPGAPRRTRRPTRRGFDFGGVLGGLFRVYRRMWVSVVLLSLILIAPGALALLKIRSDMFEAATSTRAEVYAERNADQIITSGMMFSGVSIFQVFMQMVLAGAITYLVVRHQQGRPVGVGEALARGLSRFFPVVGAVFLNLLAMTAMVIPAIILAGIAGSAGLTFLLILLAAIPCAMYWFSVFVCGPACAVEQLGPVASIKRSRMLCKGYRWYLVLLTIVMIFVGIAIGMLIQLPFIASQVKSGFGAQGMGPQLAATVADILVASPLNALMLAMTYVELRRVREGVDPEGIVGVFD